jgi:uncharacterized protein (TIGR02246 family)
MQWKLDTTEAGDMSESTHQAQTDGAPRRRGRRIGLALLIGAGAVVVALGAGYAWLGATAETHNHGEDDCTQAPVTIADGASDAVADDDVEQVCATLTSLSDAWADHDADAYGEAFTEDGTYTTFMGTHYSGRTDIVESHRVLFDGPLNGTRLADSFLSIRFISADVAVVTTRGDTYDGDRPDELAKVQTYTMSRTQDGEWLVASFHNTKRNPAMERLQFLMEPDSRPLAERG